MDMSIGINRDKDAAAMMRRNKFPALNHSTKVHTEYAIDNDYNATCHNNLNSNQSQVEVEFSVNGNTYKMNKQKLTNIGVGALVAISAYKAYKLFRDM